MAAGDSGRLATLLDLEMLSGKGVLLHPEGTPDVSMPIRKGIEVAAELGGRLLLSYIRERDVIARTKSGQILLGDTNWRVFATPTPYSSRQVVSALALPLPDLSRTHVILIDPAHVREVQGPRRVSFGYGIEYLLPMGYTTEALKLGWEKEID